MVFSKAVSTLLQRLNSDARWVLQWLVLYHHAHAGQLQQRHIPNNTGSGTGRGWLCVAGGINPRWFSRTVQGPCDPPKTQHM